MSVYAVNELCYRVAHDPAYRQTVKDDPAGAVAALDLTDAERAALLDGQVGTLCLMGAHTFLLGHLNRYELFGLTLQLYNERIRAVDR